MSRVRPQVQPGIQMALAQLTANGTCMSQVSHLRSQVSGIRYQVSGIRNQESGLSSQPSALSSQLSGLRSQFSVLGCLWGVLGTLWVSSEVFMGSSGAPWGLGPAMQKFQLSCSSASPAQQTLSDMIYPILDFLLLDD